MSKTLLIWESIPDDCHYYILDNDEDKMLVELAIKSAGRYINRDDIPDDHPIFALVDSLESMFPEGQSIRERKLVLNGPFEQVVVCGAII